MLYSVRMRAAEGGSHEQGGKHISGAEKLIQRDSLTETATNMLVRALEHSRGSADFINLTVEAVSLHSVQRTKCLPIRSVCTENPYEGRKRACETLIASGVSPEATKAGIGYLTDLSVSLRGAMLMDAQTGKRLDPLLLRGVRVSRMDVENEAAYKKWLQQQGYCNIHIREAVVLASKVMAASGMVAELCWSDDPEYTAGYVATSGQYIRFTQLKPAGSEIGGRVFFVKAGTDINSLITFLENTPVLIEVPVKEGP